MDKESFLRKLHKDLRGNFTRGEIADIISDYEGFFATGEADGKSEAEICASLGNPENIVADLAGELRRKHLPTGRTIARIGLSAVFMLTAAWLYAALSVGGNLLRDGILFVAAFSIALWIASGGALAKLPPTRGRLSDRRGWALPLGHIYLLIFCIAAYVTAQMVGLELSSTPGFFMGNLNLLSLSVAVPAVIIPGFAVYGFIAKAPVYYTLVIHATGAVAYMTGLYAALSALDTPDSFIASVHLALIVYAVSVALSAASFLYIKKLSGTKA